MLDGLLTFTSIQQLVGGSDDDTLLGADKNTTWKITGPNGGLPGSRRKRGTVIARLTHGSRGNRGKKADPQKRAGRCVSITYYAAISCVHRPQKMVRIEVLNMISCWDTFSRSVARGGPKHRVESGSLSLARRPHRLDRSDQAKSRSAPRSDIHEEVSVKAGARRVRDCPDIHSASSAEAERHERVCGRPHSHQRRRSAPCRYPGVRPESRPRP
jgi:hypothetical protein